MLAEGPGASQAAAGAPPARSAARRRASPAGSGAGARLVDGSGLSRGDRASPYRVVRLLDARCTSATSADAFLDSLPIAGRDGTLVRPHARAAPARGRCRGKTGTLSNVSALSGYCEAARGRHLRLLDPDERRLPDRRAPRLQDRMAAGDRARAQLARLAVQQRLEQARPRRAPRCPAPAPSSASQPGSSPATT